VRGVEESEKSSMNNVCLSGRLTADPDLKYGGANNTAVCHFNLAVYRPRQKDKADFPSVVCFGTMAEAVANYLKKGGEVEVVGIVATDKYEKDGRTIYKTEIIANEVKFIGKKPDSPQSQPAAAPQNNLSEWDALGKSGDDRNLFNSGDDDEVPL